ncbi:MAG: Panacea domain-containing protein [Xenococcus sp. (in: cyanobacteria)]
MTESIQFKFHAEKAVQAAALLLKLHRNISSQETMNYLGLLKMLYIADRIALERMDQPITGGCYFSMKYGLVIAEVHNLIKGNSTNNALDLWSKYISTCSDYNITLIEDPGDEELCEEEEDILREVYAKFGHLDPFTVAEWTHFLPEWQQPKPINSRVKIEVDELLKHLHKSQEEISFIRQDTLREAYLDEVLNAEYSY